MALRIRDLQAGYGDARILQGIDLTVDPGTIVAIVGPNGVGKTTLVRAVAGLLPAQAGSVHLFGRDVTRERPPVRVRHGLGYVPQGREIFGKLTVLENLLVGVDAAGLPRRRVDEILLSFPVLKPHLKKLGSKLSGGEQQMLALARAMVLEPGLLVLDEPTEGIQPSFIDDIRDTLALARETEHMAMLLVEQNLHFAAALADRAYLMERGRIVRELEPGSLATEYGLYDEFTDSGA